MNEIHVLDNHTVDKIAAGEVVERPFSIVKELVENAIDAGAGHVTVEIKDGGISMIRVTDDGSGIDKSQLTKAFLRHATSKIKEAEDLSHISSLGFRGLSGRADHKDGGRADRAAFYDKRRRSG